MAGDGAIEAASTQFVFVLVAAIERKRAFFMATDVLLAAKGPPLVSMTPFVQPKPPSILALEAFIETRDAPVEARPVGPAPSKLFMGETRLVLSNRGPRSAAREVPQAAVTTPGAVQQRLLEKGASRFEVNREARRAVGRREASFTGFIWGHEEVPTVEGTATVANDRFTASDGAFSRPILSASGATPARRPFKVVFEAFLVSSMELVSRPC